MFGIHGLAISSQWSKATSAIGTSRLPRPWTLSVTFYGVVLRDDIVLSQWVQYNLLQYNTLLTMKRKVYAGSFFPFVLSLFSMPYFSCELNFSTFISAHVQAFSARLNQFAYMQTRNGVLANQITEQVSREGHVTFESRSVRREFGKWEGNRKVVRNVGSRNQEIVPHKRKNILFAAQEITLRVWIRD